MKLLNISEKTNKGFMKTLGLVGMILFFSPVTAEAFDFYWEGSYQAEGNYFSGVDLGNTAGGDKAYLNHHLFLRPEIILYEGLSVHMGLDVLNSAGNSVPPSSRVGHILGGGMSSNQTAYNSDVPAAFTQRYIQKSRGADISEAYLKYSHTNGELRFGRQPLHFGYGAFYNRGYNVFDHWYTNRDGVSYSFNMGSLSFTPMFNFISSAAKAGEQATEFGLKFKFDVEDTGLNLGFMFLQRHVPTAMVTANPVPGSGVGPASPKTYSVFYNRKRKTHSYGFEAMFQDGTAGGGLALKGFGFAGQAEWQRKKWNFAGKFGYAQGDDPTKTNEISSVAMHRNYNLGMLLFNHPLGASNFDPLGTGVRGRRGALSAADYSADSVVDTESISNAMYLAPSATYLFNRKWDLKTTLVMAWLDETNIAGVGEVSSFLGTELDLVLTFNPTENITYKTGFAYFAPGSAFDGAGTLKNDSVFGATLSLGVTF